MHNVLISKHILYSIMTGYKIIAFPYSKVDQKKQKKKVSVPWQWGDAQLIAFNTIKDKLSSPPILAYAYFCKPCILHTDASSE